MPITKELAAVAPQSIVSEWRLEWGGVIEYYICFNDRRLY